MAASVAMGSPVSGTENGNGSRLLPPHDQFLADGAGGGVEAEDVGAGGPAAHVEGGREAGVRGIAHFSA